MTIPRTYHLLSPDEHICTGKGCGDFARVDIFDEHDGATHQFCTDCYEAWRYGPWPSLGELQIDWVFVREMGR